MASLLARARQLRTPWLLLDRRRALSSAKPPEGLGDVQQATEISTLKLYRDCMRLTYHVAAQV